LPRFLRFGIDDKYIEMQAQKEGKRKALAWRRRKSKIATASHRDTSTQVPPAGHAPLDGSASLNLVKFRKHTPRMISLEQDEDRLKVKISIKVAFKISRHNNFEVVGCYFDFLRSGVH